MILLTPFLTSRPLINIVEFAQLTLICAEYSSRHPDHNLDGYGVAEPLASWKVINQHDGEVSTLSTSMLTLDVLRFLMIRWWGIPADSSSSQDVLAEYHRIWVWFKTAVLKRLAPEEWNWMKTRSEYGVV